ncbi:hypothetical protein GCM10022225_77330 [Plantactinospora mayteni]|uniref:zinc-binding dehydrogenase n=1 Tax=Plantactinospora mayteni TaxID=566021 RepID=UPI001940CD5D|nr:zinc-binding dehydrogenase [Plantactinospora mayteni]
MLPNGRHGAVYRLSTAVRRHPQRIRDSLYTLVDELRSGAINPLVAQQVPLEKAAEAHRLVEDRGVAGKIVLVP